MGLDMYLNKHTYIKNWSFMDKPELHEVTIKKGGKVRKDIEKKKISSIIAPFCKLSIILVCFLLV